MPQQEYLYELHEQARPPEFAGQGLRELEEQRRQELRGHDFGEVLGDAMLVGS